MECGLKLRVEHEVWRLGHGLANDPVKFVVLVSPLDELGIVGKLCELLEALADCGEPRFHGLNTMLATSLQAIVKTGELGRSLNKRSVNALRDGKLIAGRQIVYMIVDRF